jgi:hypothetical protein
MYSTVKEDCLGFREEKQPSLSKNENEKRQRTKNIQQNFLMKESIKGF